LKENALVTLAELAPAVVVKLGPEEARAPSSSDSGFSLDADPVRMFAHGGVSLEEMIVPVAVLATKK
jgi:hypothetical protein